MKKDGTRPPQIMRFWWAVRQKCAKQKQGSYKPPRKIRKKPGIVKILGFFLVRQKGLEPLTY